MNFLLKVLKWAGIIVVVVIAGFVIFVLTNSDPTFEAPYPEITASTDSAIIARGKYLVHGPAHCAHCHTSPAMFPAAERGEEVPLTGGFTFSLPLGDLYTPNITPHETGIGNNSDQEIARVLRHGVRRDGGPMMDFMPFYDLGDDDLTAIISYLRTTEPIESSIPDHDWSFLGKMVKAIGGIKPMGDGEIPTVPPRDSSVVSGKYLAESIANCQGCHSNRNLKTGGWIGPRYAGGFPMEMITEDGQIDPNRHVVTPNLTPDPGTGIMANWSQEDFISRFRTGRIIPGSPMPWGPFSRMSDLELVAIYKYLRSLDPVTFKTPLGVQAGPPPGY